MQMQQPEDHLEAPKNLIRALRGLPGPNVFIPPSLDDSILGAAQRHLVSRARPAYSWSWLTPSLALASIIVFLVVAGPLQKRASHEGMAAQITHEDVNQDGRVDVLDAFALARQLRDHGATTTGWDVNGDGIVDE